MTERNILDEPNDIRFLGSGRAAHRTASYASNPAYIGRGLTVDGELLSRDDAERAVAGNLSASDITRIATSWRGSTGEWWGICGVFGDLADFQDYAWTEDTLATYREDWDDYGVLGALCVVLIAKRPDLNGEQWDPEVHNPADALMGNSYLPQGQSVEVVECWYDAGNGWRQAPGSGGMVRTSAIPGGGLPYPSSDFGYQWYDLGNGEYYADSRDGSITLGIDVNAPGGQVFWQAEDDLGVVEEGNFSGMDRRDIKLVLQRADRQLSQLDSMPSVRQKSRDGYQEDYAERFDDSNWREPAFRY
ncbi:hypothetical protein KHQ86_gp020 [Gordonia phage Stormageddon]|uniref:Uncharacterized protein n=1 Tax=Gordonia phage Stormageddon TaxID=2656541 RepID=A0A649VTJ3_9CAUD|nr:hypothetical protein KHQ86_gp020 [Gordonia phage Stormageddon]QGJ94883.1 hypothetical protein SEA_STORMAGEDDON_20 [Gordonia phage Stormageddon]